MRKSNGTVRIKSMRYCGFQFLYLYHPNSEMVCLICFPHFSLTLPYDYI